MRVSKAPVSIYSWYVFANGLPWVGVGVGIGIRIGWLGSCIFLSHGLLFAFVHFICLFVCDEIVLYAWSISLSLSLSLSLCFVNHTVLSPESRSE